MRRPTVIGVAGGSGAGKTTVVREIIRALGEEHVAVVHHDSYYRDQGHLPPEEREEINYDHPDALETSLLVQHLEELREGTPVEVPTYDFTDHTRREETTRIVPREAIIVDGILILADAELRRLLDIKVFVDTDDDIRLIRRLRRDMEERGRTLSSVIDQYLTTVKPMHLEFVEPSKRYADVIIPEGGYNRVAVDMVTTKLKSLVEGS